MGQALVASGFQLGLAVLEGMGEIQCLLPPQQAEFLCGKTAAPS